MQSIAPTGPVPSQSDPRVEERYQAAQRCLDKGALSNCSQFLNLALEKARSQPAPDVKSLEQTLELTCKLLDVLVQEKEFDKVREWICPSAQGLLCKLSVISREKAPALLPQVRAAFEEGAASIPAGDSIEELKLKITFLSRAYHLAKLAGEAPKQISLLTAIGHLYLQLAALLPSEHAFDGALREASVSFNIALSLDPKSSELHAELSRVESNYLTSQGHGLESVYQWARNHIWVGKSPQHLAEAEETAELLIEYGQTELACSVYTELASYHDRFPSHYSSRFPKRHLELSTSDGVKITSFRWKKDRQSLSAIRGLTAHLFSRYHNGPEIALPEIPASIAPTLLKTLKKFDLVPEALDSLEQLSEDLVIGHLSIHELQLLHGELMTSFTAKLYERAITLFGKPPCDYCLVGLGSLARGEMNVYSDLDAILLVETKDQEVEAFFKRVAEYLELLFLSLGETKCTFARFDHLKDQFCLDPALLHPGRLIERPEGLLKYQQEEVTALAEGHDLDPIRNALRLTCYISGTKELLDSYQQALHTFLGEQGRAAAYGEALISNWSPPPLLQGGFDAKRDLYRPITLLIDGLAVRHHVPGRLTTERLCGLQDYLPQSLFFRCKQGLELACRLRLQAQLHYGEESEQIYLTPVGQEARPLIPSHDDLRQLREVDTLLFSPLSKVDLLKELPDEPFEAAKSQLLEEYYRRGWMGHVASLIPEIEAPPAQIEAARHLWEGHFALALQVAEEADLVIGKSNLFQQATDLQSILPQSPAIGRLFGRLWNLKVTCERSELPPPKPGLFAGGIERRKRKLYQYLCELPFPLSDEVQARAWNLARSYLKDIKPLPASEQALLADLVDVEDADRSDLQYADLLGPLREVLAQTREPLLLQAIFRLCPRPLHNRLHRELSRIGVDAHLIELISRYPEPDGSRPLVQVVSGQLTLDFLVDAEGRGQVEGIHSPPSTVSSPALSFFQELILGKRGEYGRHSVGCYGGTYFKRNPEFPGREQAFTSLYRLVTGYSFPPRQLIRLTIDSKVHAFSASTEVAGPNLQEILDDRPCELANLDFRHYCFQVLLYLIALPEDAKPDNFIFYTPEADGKAQLIDVDPERTFFAPMKRHMLKENEVQCKCILFCLDQMKGAVDPLVREEFLALQPAALFERWLDKIDLHNQRCEELFGVPFIDRGMQAQSPSTLPFFIEPSPERRGAKTISNKGLLLRLYERFRSLQEALRSDPHQPLIDLLAVVSFELSDKYRGELELEKPAIRRFCDLTANQYRRDAGSTISVTTTSLGGSHAKFADYIRNGWTVESAREDLKRIIRADSSGSVVSDDLLNREGAILKSLGLPEISDSVLRRINFSKLPAATQEAVLKRITGLQFRRLHLTNCQVLTDRKFKAILEHSPHLTLLDLGNCRGIQSPTYIAKLCPRIKKLILRGIPTLANVSGDGWFTTEPALFPNLVSLDISDCKGLKRLSIVAPKLKHLRCLGTLPTGISLRKSPGVALRLSRLWIDSDKTLGQLLDYAPKILDFDGSEVEAIDAISPQLLIQAKAIALSQGYVSYQSRAGDFTAMIKLAKLLGYPTFTIRSRAGRQQTQCFVHPFDTNMDAFEFPSLTTLDLSGRRVKDEWLGALAKRCPQLANLNLNGCREVTEAGLVAIAENCPKLARLELYNCHALKGDKWLLALAKHCSQLVYLNLTSCRATDAGLIAITQGSRQLTHLDLSCCKRVTDAVLLAISECCPLLTTLRLTGCRTFTEEGLGAIAERCTQLTHLDIPFVGTDAKLQAIAPNCPQLVRLNLQGCKGVTNEGLLAIAKHCSRLADLQLRECGRVGDTGVIATAQGCPQLAHLNLFGCSQVTDEALGALAEHCKQMTSINLSGLELHVGWRGACKRVTSAGLIAIAEGCPQLTKINLAGCERIGDAGLRAIAERCPQLKALTLDGCKVTNDGLRAIAEHSKQLQSLSLAKCKRVTDVALQIVARRLPNLTFISLRDCPGTSKRGIQALEDARPDLNVH